MKISFWYFAGLYVNFCVKTLHFGLKMAIFLLLPIFASILCYHSNHKSQSNIRSKHLDHSSIKTRRIKYWAATFIFSLWGGPENPVNARPSLLSEG